MTGAQHGGILVRRATPEDAGAVARVLRQAFAEHRPRYTDKAFRATAVPPAGVRKRMQEGPVWVALLNDVPVATASAVVTAQGCYVRGMGVIPAARGHRIGRRLLEKIEQFARTEGLSMLYLSTTPFLDRAIALYEHFGFQRADRGPAELFGTPLFTMVKPLSPYEGE